MDYTFYAYLILSMFYLLSVYSIGVVTVFYYIKDLVLEKDEPGIYEKWRGELKLYAVKEAVTSWIFIIRDLRMKLKSE